MRFVAIYKHSAKSNIAAMCEVFFKRVTMRGVAFGVSNLHKVKPALAHYERSSVARTFGLPHWTALQMGHPPRKPMTHCTKLMTASRAGADHAFQHPVSLPTPERLSPLKAMAGQATLRPT